MKLWEKSCEGSREKLEGREWALDLIQTYYTHIWILNINLPVLWFCLFILTIHLCLLVTLLSKLFYHFADCNWGWNWVPVQHFSSFSSGVGGNKGGYEQTALLDRSDVSCLTAVGDWAREILLLLVSFKRTEPQFYP